MSLRARRPGRRFAVAALACTAACGGPTFDGHVFRGEDVAFRVPGVPRDWRRIEATGALLAFRDDTAAASIAVGGRCGRDADDVPLGALTHHLFLHFTERTVEGQIRTQLDGREALRTDLTARLDGVKRRFTVFVLKKNGCVYDFVHVAPPGAPADGRARFVAFVEGFSTLAP
jgi:hypothetical protein